MWVKKLIKEHKLNRKHLIFLACLVFFAASVIGVHVSAANAEDKVEYTIELNSESDTASSLDDVGPADEMKDGAILHAWCWSFDTIKENMEDIADAGYTSVQTSPVMACVVGNNGDLKFTNQWWYQYQPTDYTIGNYQLGTEDEFAEMCDVADEYGIRIIVDVVANHCTSDYSKISSNITSISNFFHTNTAITDWTSRYQITQLAVLGLWDNNTQNTNVQAYIKKFLTRCIELGADGFRFDAAKHIELPDDDSSYAGNFWPNILDNGAEFQYGEVLQDSYSRDTAYANYMSVTASYYGKKLRDNISSNNFSASTLLSYESSVDSDLLVTWVESHDNYANDITDSYTSQWMTDEQIKLLWAVIGAREGGTPLFFSRPVGGGGQTWDNRFPETTQIGDRGSDLFMDDEIAAVNKFRNAMGDESEYLRNPSGNTAVLMIERGDEGVVIINALSSAYSLSSTTNLADGTYENQTDDDSVYTVSSGVITGTLPARSVVVLAGQVSTNEPAVSIEDAVTSFKTDTCTLTLTATNTVYSTYQINDEPSYLYEDNDTITIGEGDDYGTVYVIELRGINDEGVTVSKTYTITKKDPSSGLEFYFEKPSSWGSTIYAYVYDESGTTVQKLAAWPGVTMENLGDSLYYYDMTEEYDVPLVIFSDGTNQSPGANKTGFTLVDGTTYTINGALTTQEAPAAPTVNTVTATKVILNEISGAEYCVDDGDWQTSTTFSDLTPSTTYTFYARYAETTTALASDASEGTEVTTLDESESSNTITIYYYTSWSTAYIHYKIGDGSWTTTPGVAMTSSSVSGYKQATIDLGDEETLTACFNNGSGTWDNNSSQNYYFSSPGEYKVINGVITEGAASTSNTITVYYYTSWTAPYIYYQIGSGSWTTSPGVAMSSSSVSGYKVATVSLGSSVTFTACFNNGSGSWDNNSSKNYKFYSPGTYTVNNGTITTGTPS